MMTGVCFGMPPWSVELVIWAMLQITGLFQDCKQHSCIHLLRVHRARWAQVKKDFQEIVLSARQDDFYRRHMYSNFGDAGAAVKSLVDEFQRQTTSSQNINTIEDMQVLCYDLL